MKDIQKFFQPALIVSFFLLTTQVASAVGKPAEFSSPRSAVAVSKSCEPRANAIKKRMGQLVKLATTMQEKFDAIAARVETYYADTVLPSGKTVTNYTTLVNDIALKKNGVQDALTKTQIDVNNFNCTTGNPKTLFNQFRLDMQTTKTALKNYRTTIKNLIVAVRSVTGESDKLTPKPTPTVTPGS